MEGFGVVSNGFTEEMTFGLKRWGWGRGAGGWAQGAGGWIGNGRGKGLGAKGSFVCPRS